MIPHRVPVRVLRPHDDSALWDYHEWVHLEGDTVTANCDGIYNPRMTEAEWQRWLCNNPTCPAVAFVSDQHVAALIDTHGGTP